MPETHPDLFSDAYPDAPGWRGTDTSREAAVAEKEKASVIRQMVLEALKVRDMTSFEIAHHIKRSYPATQPRTSELKAKGLIEDSGKRGISRDPTKSAVVWTISPQR